MHLFATELILNQSTRTNLAKKYTIHIFCKKCTIQIFCEKWTIQIFCKKRTLYKFSAKTEPYKFSAKINLTNFLRKMHAPYNFLQKIIQVSRCHTIPCEPWFPGITCCLSTWQFYSITSRVSAESLSSSQRSLKETRARSKRWCGRLHVVLLATSG